MSNSAVLSVPRAISSAFVVGSMMAAIAVTPATSVRINVGTVKMDSSNAVHGTLSGLSISQTY